MKATTGNQNAKNKKGMIRRFERLNLWTSSELNAAVKVLMNAPWDREQVALTTNPTIDIAKGLSYH